MSLTLPQGVLQLFLHLDVEISFSLDNVFIQQLIHLELQTVQPNVLLPLLSSSYCLVKGADV